MARLIRFYKPYGVLSQFTTKDDRRTLADFITVDGVYAAGRLDFDSEGLLLLTDDGRLQARIADPRHRMEKIYLAQVLCETADPEDAAHWSRVADALARGVVLRDGTSRASRFERLVAEPALPPRTPPVVARHARSSVWVRIGLRSGRNREVRRLLAAVGHPVLRLVRVRIGPFDLEGLTPGDWRAEEVGLPKAINPSRATTPGARHRATSARPSGTRRPRAPSSRRRRPS